MREYGAGEGLRAQGTMVLGEQVSLGSGWGTGRLGSEQLEEQDAVAVGVALEHVQALDVVEELWCLPCGSPRTAVATRVKRASCTT